MSAVRERDDVSLREMSPDGRDVLVADIIRFSATQETRRAVPGFTGGQRITEDLRQRVRQRLAVYGPAPAAFGVLAEVETGLPLLLSELTLTTALRTAAMSAVAAAALARPDSDEERWMRAAGNAEAMRDGMLKDVDRWIERCCKDQQDVPGCS